MGVREILKRIMSKRIKEVTWIIENLSKEVGSTELAAAVEKAGHPLIKINGDYCRGMIDHLNMDNDNMNISLPNSCVIFHGSIEMAKLVRSHLDGTCQPVVYCDFPKYKCSSYYSYFGNFLFNDKYVMMSLGEIARNKFFLYGNFGKEALMFIRPDSGEKTFQAQLVDILYLDKFIAKNDDIKHDLVLISTPKTIKWEGRFLVNRNKEIITYSTYQFQGQKTLIPAVPNEALDKCKEILNVGYCPDSIFCVDICQGEDNKFYLLELTSFSSAGVYAMDKNKVVAGVNAMAIQDSEKRL